VLQGNEETLTSLEQLLGDVDRARESVRGTGESARWQAISSNGPIRDRLLDPVVKSLRRDQLPQSDVDAFLNMLRDILDVLTEDNVASIEVTTEREAIAR
jgi:hypothetical protein